MDKLFSTDLVEKLYGFKTGRLKYWARTGLISPTESSYTFQDIIAIKVIKALLDKGLSIQRIRRLIGQLRRLIPDSQRPLLELRIQSDGERISLSREGDYLEPTGQLLFDFGLRDLKREVAGAGLHNVEALSPQPPEKTPSRPADYWFKKGLSLDTRPKTYHRAIEAYKRAIEIDPKMVEAYTNLGTLYYKLKMPEKAKELYLQATDLDDTHKEAYFNLANVLMDELRYGEAITHLRRVLRLDPEFADAYFNLALCLEYISKKREARRYWEAYLQRDPSSEWSEMVREHLNTRP